MTPDMFRKLAALGLSTDQMAGVLEIMEGEAEVRKEKARSRVQKWREKKRDETQRNVTKHNETSRDDLHGGDARGVDNLLTTEISGQKEKKVTSPSARSSRGSRIPDDFCPDLDAAVSEGVPRSEAERQARSFCDYWRSKPGAAGLKLDWPATWRVWYRRSIPPDPKPQSAGPPRPPRTVSERAIQRLQTGQTTYEPPDKSDRSLVQGFGSGQNQGASVLELVAIAANGYRRS